MRKTASLKKLVNAYIECGNRIGFFYAEMILMKYCPEDRPDGKCYDVHPGDRQTLIEDLETFTPEEETE